MEALYSSKKNILIPPFEVILLTLIFSSPARPCRQLDSDIQKRSLVNHQFPPNLGGAVLQSIESRLICF